MNSDQTTEAIQWAGSIAVIAGHVLNSIGPSVYPWNIIAFSIGTILFFAWSYRVKNRPQFIVNIVAIITCAIGLIKAFL